MRINISINIEILKLKLEYFIDFIYKRKWFNFKKNMGKIGYLDYNNL